MASKDIKISNGTRQGCPLSPLLFVLIMEHLITAIRNNKDIKGIKAGDKEYKIAAYADDLLIYITNPIITIPNLMKAFRRFGELSHFKVNYDKSEILNISVNEKIYSLLQEDFPFKWKQNAIKYLGVFITKDLKQLQGMNYEETIQKTIKLLQKYDKLMYSWMGRINKVKMEILPKLLYIFQTIPLDPPKN